MKSLCLVAFLIAGFVPVASAQSTGAPAPLSPDDPVYERIIEIERERMEAYVRSDLEYLRQSFADEYLHTNLRGGTTTKAEELHFYAGDDFSLGGGEIGPFTMRRYGDVVVATGTVSWEEVLYQGVDLSGNYAITRVYVHRDGRWQLATSHASQIPPGQ